MKIVQVTNSYKPAWQTGGVCRVSYDISTELRKKNHDVSVLTTNWGSESEVAINQWVDVDGVKVIYYKNWAPTNFIGKMAFPVYPILHGIEVVLDADVVHLHEYRSAMSIMVSRLCKKYGIPYVIQMHGAFSQTIGKANQKKLYDGIFGEGIIANASGIIALTRTEANQLMATGIPEEKIKIIPNGIDPNIFKSLPEEGTFRKRWSLTSNRIVLYLGRLDVTKGVDLLIKGFASQFSGNKDISLVLIGPDDGIKQHLVKLTGILGLEEQIKYLGYVDAFTKLSALIDSDVVVCPSYNGFPIVILEACACGKPIVTTTNGDEIDLLNERVGISTIYDPLALGKAIRSLLEDKKRMILLGSNGKKIVLKDYTIERVVDQILYLYKDIIL